MNEIWKDIKDYEGLYQVSNLGKIKSLDRYVKQFNNGIIVTIKYKGKILKQKQEKSGYLRVNLSKDGKAKLHFVHRLVAEAFIEKKNENNIVNHLDNNPLNNKAENLEWTTYKGNMQYSTKQGRMHYNKENLKKAQESRKKPIIGIRGNEILRFGSAKEAEKFGFNHRHICSCCKNRYGYRSHKGYEWRYENE